MYSLNVFKHRQHRLQLSQQSKQQPTKKSCKQPSRITYSSATVRSSSRRQRRSQCEISQRSACDSPGRRTCLNSSSLLLSGICTAPARRTSPSLSWLINPLHSWNNPSNAKLLKLRFLKELIRYVCKS